MTEEYFEEMAALILPGPVIQLPNLEHHPLYYGPRRRPIPAAAAARPAAANHQEPQYNVIIINKTQLN